MSVENRRFRSTGSRLTQHFRDRPHQPFFFSRNQGKWSFVWYKNAGTAFFRSVTNHTFDRETNRQNSHRQTASAFHAARKKWDCRRCTENYGRSNEVTRHTTSHVSLQFEFKQVAQLSQRDRAAGCVSFGKKCKTGTGGQYSTEIISLFSITVTSSACTAIDFGEKLQNTGGYGVQDHSRSSRSVPIKSLRLPISDQQ